MRTLVLLAIGLLAACPKSEPKPAPAPPPVVEPVRAEPDAGVVADMTAVTLDERRCTSNAECALVTEDCCGCNGGGKQVGVRKDALAGLTERRTPICSSVVCTQMQSDDPSCDARRARCMEGECVADFPGAKPSAGLGVEKIPE